MTFAHVAGLPVEELLVLWAAGSAGGGAVFARAWLGRRRYGQSSATAHSRRRRSLERRTAAAGRPGGQAEAERSETWREWLLAGALL